MRTLVSQSRPVCAANVLRDGRCPMSESGGRVALCRRHRSRRKQPGVPSASGMRKPLQWRIRTSPGQLPRPALTTFMMLAKNQTRKIWRVSARDPGPVRGHDRPGPPKPAGTVLLADRRLAPSSISPDGGVFVPLSIGTRMYCPVRPAVDAGRNFYG